MPIQQYNPADYMKMVDTALHRVIGYSLPNNTILFLGHPERGVDLESKTAYAQTYCRAGVQDDSDKAFTWGVKVESKFPEFNDDTLMKLEPVLRRYAFFGSKGVIGIDVMLESDDFSTVTGVVISKGLTAAKSKELTAKYEHLKGKSLEDGITALVQHQMSSLLRL